MESLYKLLRVKSLQSNNTHGSGCTYSAAVTAYLSLRKNLVESIAKASYFTKKAIENGAHGTLNQMWKINNHKLH
jgi:Hydroxymethylpyrimidine/phosphomethylpyrimidine kinase